MYELGNGRMQKVQLQTEVVFRVLVNLFIFIFFNDFF